MIACFLARVSDRLMVTDLWGRTETQDFDPKTAAIYPVDWLAVDELYRS
jgi:hypothetical protein